MKSLVITLVTREVGASQMKENAVGDRHEELGKRP